MVVRSEIRTRKKRAKKASSSPKFPLKAALEAPQVPSLAVEIEEVQIAQEAEVIEKVQESEVEIESLAIMSGAGETHGHSEEEDVKRYLKYIQRMVKIMFDAFTAKRTREGSKPPHG